MSLHPQLSKFSNKHHIKQFSKALNVVLPLFPSLGISTWEVVVESYSPDKSSLRRMFQFISVEKIDQTMSITAECKDFTVNIDFSMINNGWLLPLEVYFFLPLPTAHILTCRRAMFGRKWQCDPKNNSLCNRLDNILPKVRKNHIWGALIEKLDIFYHLEPLENDTTLFFIRSGMKQGVFGRPKIDLSPYFQSARRVTDILHIKQ